MAQSNQSPGGLRGVTPLAYAGTTPNMVFNTRRPTARDVFNFELGTWWIIPKKKSNAPAIDRTREVWILVGNSQQTASWKRLHGGGGPSGESHVIVTVYSTPGAGTHTFQPDLVDVLVECVGGGGGSAGIYIQAMTDSEFAGNGGGGGSYVSKLFTSLEVGESKSFVVGSGGIGGIVLNPTLLVQLFPGGNGNATTFGSFITAGAGGGSGMAIGSGGSATGGDINVYGSDGGSALAFSLVFPEVILIPANGGLSGKAMGPGGVYIGQLGPQPNTGLPVIGKPYGGGASGGKAITRSSGEVRMNGAAGASGVIIFTEYLG